LRGRVGERGKPQARTAAITRCCVNDPRETIDEVESVVHAFVE
jgi:hypothetical protein